MNDEILSTLLENFNSVTKDCQVINEGIDVKKIAENISKGISATGNFIKSGVGLSKSSKDIDQLIKQVSKIRITDSYRVVTYPNIHNNIKYNISAGVMINYVLKQIDECYEKGIPIDSDKINGEAIAYAFNTVTGKKYGKSMTIDQFNIEYKKSIFGSLTKVQLIPNLSLLVLMAKRYPVILSYIDKKLILKHIRSLNDYSNELSKMVITKINDNPSNEALLNSSLICFQSTIRNLSRIYRCIRQTIQELEYEYKNVFRRIIQINNSLQPSITETAEYINNELNNLKTYTNQPYSLNESISFDEYKKDITKHNKSQELKSKVIYLETNMAMFATQEIPDEFECSKHLINGLNTDIIDSITKASTKLHEYLAMSTDDCDINTILTNIIPDNIEFIPNGISSINDILKYITNKYSISVLGCVNMKSNIDPVIDNLLISIEICKYISEEYDRTYGRLITLITEESELIKNKNYNINKLIRVTLYYITIILAIFNNLYKYGELTINSIKQLSLKGE